MGLNIKAGRFMELEGLRAIAAVVVVLYHASLIFYPAFFYGVGTTLAPVQNAGIESFLYQNPLSGVLSGTFAVGIFFVLSGFVLSIAFFQKQDQSIIRRMAAKRYIRLMVPAFFSVILAWLAIRMGGSVVMGKVVSVTHSGWLAGLWTFSPHLHTALFQGVVGIFTSVANTTYNPVLWTINYEFLGSFIVFGAALLFGQMRNRWVVYLVLIFALANSWLLGFMLGMVLADLYANRHGLIQQLDVRIKIGLIFVGIVFGGFPAGPITNPVYRFLEIPKFLQTEQISFYITIGATLLVFAALTLRPFTRFLAHPRISGFGKYTYSLYLIHMPILFTVCTGTFLVFHHIHIGFHTASLFAIFVTAVVLVPLVYLFERYIDAPAIKLSSYMARVFLEQDIIKYLNIAARRSVHLIFPRRHNLSNNLTDTEME